MFLFLPKLWELFTQIERSQQRLGGVGGGDGSDDNSIDGFIYNNGGWVNGSGNLPVLAQGSAAAAAAAAAANGSGGAGSMNEGSQYLSAGRRKGSIGTLDESKSESLKETHLGYMGVKFQNRWLPFLSSWCMRRVILYPAGRFFTCFELGKPETGRTFSYISVFIHSRESGSYILRVIGCGRFDFLFQVRDEERLLYWYNLFDNNRQPPPSNQWSSSMNGGNGGDNGVMMPLGNLSMGNLTLMNGLNLAPPSPSYQGHGSNNGGGGGGGLGLTPGINPRSESDQTLHGDMSMPPLQHGSASSNGNSNDNSNNGVDESTGFSQVSSNYFNSILHPQQQYLPQQQYQQQQQQQQYQQHYHQASNSVANEALERSRSVEGEQQELRGQRSVVDLGTLSRVGIEGNDGQGQGQQQQQYERRYI
ncbi:hypothetical protein BGZ95_003297 [Linnemannia exigua]|uniref:PH domain-containing protein n=1 Tax=Linnemannia exigua TaxID=604196 RepID=A0AAD4D6H7_9FUNG|nr:hypothetical protein BGZ95_003297 [Linnemannia exigua]